VKLPDGISQPLLLGKGAEGDVFRAWQEPPGRTVVVKRSRDAEGARRLAREARLLSSLAGMPVPGLLAFQQGLKHSVLVLEWLEGVSLDVFDAAGLKEGARRALLLETCRAVSRLHGVGIVHGDLSCANLLAHARGGIDVVDLGVARRLGEMVPTGLGAWEVVAPEALHGQLPTLQSDVYALGCLALHLWDAIPVQARTSRSLWCELGAAGELAERAHAIHPAFAKALAPEPERRQVSAAGLLRELEEDWSEFLWPGKEIQDLFVQREQAILETGVVAAISRRDWDDAWRLQKLRVELAADPEPLLAQLSRLSRRRMGQARRRWVPWFCAGACLLIGTGAFLWFSRDTRQGEALVLPLEVQHPANDREDDDLFPAGPKLEGRLLPYAVGPQPPDTRLWIDGQPEELPEDDTIWFEPGDYHVEVRDASGNLIRDTLVHFHPREHLRNRRHAKPARR